MATRLAYAVRFVTSTSAADGYYLNRFTGADENATEDTLARVSLVWAPLSDLSIDLSYEYSEFETDGHVGELFGPGGAAADGDGTLDWERSMDGSLLPLFPDGAVAAGIDSEQQQLRLGIDYLVGGHRLTLLAAHVDSDWDLHHDLDGTPMQMGDVGFREDYEQNSIELRAASPTGGTIDYVLGIFYNDATLDSQVPGLVDGTAFLEDLGFPFDGFEYAREWADGRF